VLSLLRLTRIRERTAKGPNVQAKMRRRPSSSLAGAPVVELVSLTAGEERAKPDSQIKGPKAKPRT